jgi:hypothetical protein
MGKAGQAVGRAARAMVVRSIWCGLFVILWNVDVRIGVRGMLY